MTGEEAVKVLNALWKYKNCGFSEKKIREALDMAIKSIEIIADEFCEMKKAECIFNVYKNEKNTERKEIKEEIKEEIEMLMMLKKQARYNDTNTLIEDVRLSSFNFVIDKVIKSLEAESEEK